MPSEIEIEQEIDNLIATSKMAKKFLLVDLDNKEIEIAENKLEINLEEREKEKPMIIMKDKIKKDNDVPGLF